MQAKLVHVHGFTNEPAIPDEMGEPGRDQLLGSPLERLAEVAGRVCYDSFGVGRTSPEFHCHILGVKHLSVYEHCVFTLEWHPFKNASWMQYFLNRPGVYVHWDHDVLRVTLNARSVLEWNDYDQRPTAKQIGLYIQAAAHAIMPWVIPPVPPVKYDVIMPAIPKVVLPELDTERWATLWFSGSRAFSHELVRHGDWTAISQRSTRYVDESESLIHDHPLLIDLQHECQEFMSDIDHLRSFTAELYRSLVDKLMRVQEAHGIDRATARKQARGAARLYLPNGLDTQVIFSASLAQWRRIFNQRCSAAADAEIRVIMEEARGVLESAFSVARETAYAGAALNRRHA